MPQPHSRSLIIGEAGGVARLTLNRPQKHNVIDYDMWVGITDALSRFADDDAVRVIVLNGAGERAFSAGADISEFESKRDEGSAESYNQATAEAHEALRNCPKPTIAEIGGYCIGGGLGLALACDLRIASNQSRFGIPAARLGLGYDYSSLKALVELVGPAVTKDLLFTARRLGADEAQGFGLVNTVVDPDRLRPVVEERARAIASNAPLTVRASKRIVIEVLKDPAQRDVELCDRLVAECFASEDYREGRQAFMEKRSPRFRGR